MDRIDNQIQRSLISHWEEFDTYITRLNASASVEPKDGYSVFKYAGTEDGSAIFDLQPVLVNVPERATDTSSDLFVVVKGRLSIDRAHFEAEGKIRTLNFATQVGYFRLKGGVLKHVFGAHYDFSESEVGHPVFHAQMRSFVQFSEVIKERYGLEEVVVDDGINGILKTVRLPSAQMDVFSFFLQLVADHLLSKDSSGDDRVRFLELLDKSKFIQGVGSVVSRLQVPPANFCYRAVHWYSPSS
jgi:hypothetical protein